MRYKFSKTSIVIIAVAVIVALIAWGRIKQYSGPPLPGMPFTESLPFNSGVSNAGNGNTNQDSSANNTTAPSIPATHLLKVPFTPQAPTANWDELHNEACEEASAIMTGAYFAGDTRTTLPAGEVEQQISDLTNWQKDHFGYFLNTTAEETAQMIESVYHLHTKIISNFSEDDIKQQIAAGNLVIVPENGQLLGNPNYKQPGPIYHMLVVRGYTTTSLITNDSGTKRGQNYSYTFDVIKKAAANWDHSTNTVDLNKKVMIVVSK